MHIRVGRDRGGEAREGGGSAAAYGRGRPGGETALKGQVLDQAFVWTKWQMLKPRAVFRDQRGRGGRGITISMFEVFLFTVCVACGCGFGHRVFKCGVSGEWRACAVACGTDSPFACALRRLLRAFHNHIPELFRPNYCLFLM